MVILPSKETCNKWPGKIYISKALQAKRKNETGDDDRPCKIRRTSSSDITNLPDDFLSIIFKRLETRDDRNSFKLTCRQLLQIYNHNCQSLWWNRDRCGRLIGEALRSPNESFSIVLSKLLSRFPNLRYLSLMSLPKITDFVALQPQFSASKLQNLCLDNSNYSDTEFSLMFSWLPRLTYVSLMHCLNITDRGLEALAKCCSSLKTLDISYCQKITDSGIAEILHNCHELSTLCIFSCSEITGIGFLGCQETLTDVDARRCKLCPEGIEAIVSGGGLKRLGLSAPHKLPEVGQGLRRTY